MKENLIPSQDISVSIPHREATNQGFPCQGYRCILQPVSIPHREATNKLFSLIVAGRLLRFNPS